MAEKENRVIPMSLPGHGDNRFNVARAMMAHKSPAGHTMSPRAAFSPVVTNMQKESLDSHTPVVPNPLTSIKPIAHLQAPPAVPEPSVLIQPHVSDKTPLKAPIVRVVGSSQKRSRRSSEGESVESLRSQLEEERTEQVIMRKRVADLITKTLSKTLLTEKGLESSGVSSDRNYFALVELLNGVKQDRAREQRESQEQIDFLEAQLQQVQNKQEDDFLKRASASPQTDRFSPQQVTRSGTLQCESCHDSRADLKKAKSELTEAINLVDARNLQIKELTSKLSTTEQQNNQITQENRRLTMDLSTDEKGMQSMYALQNDLIQEIQKQKSAIAKLHASRAELEKKLSTAAQDHDSETKELRMQIKELQDRAASMQKQDSSSHVSKQENARLEAEVKRLRLQNSEQAATFDQQMASVTQQVSDIRDKYHKVRDENFTVSGKQVELDKMVLNLHKERAEFDQKMGRMHQEKAQVDATIGRMEHNRVRMEAHIKQLQEEKQQADSALLHAKQEKLSADAENEKLALQLRELDVARRNVNASKQELQNAKSETAQLAAQLAEAENTCAQLAAQVEELQRKTEAPPAEKVFIAAQVKVIKTVPGSSLTWANSSATSSASPQVVDTRASMPELPSADFPGHRSLSVKASQPGQRQNLNFFSGSAPPMAAAPAPALIRPLETTVPETPTTDFGDKHAPEIEELDGMLPVSQGALSFFGAAPALASAPPRLLTPPKPSADASESEGKQAGGGLDLFSTELSKGDTEGTQIGNVKVTTGRVGDMDVASWEVGMQNVELTADGKIIPVKTALPTLTEDPIAELGSPAPPLDEAGKGKGRGGLGALLAGKAGPPVVTATLGVLGAGTRGVLGMQM